MELKGKIIAVLEERSGVAKASGKPYRVAQYVLETIEQYPKKMLFEVFGDDRINQMNILLGEVLTVSFDIDSREYNGKWYNQIRAWKVERETDQTSQPQDASIDNSDPIVAFQEEGNSSIDDGVLPF